MGSWHTERLGCVISCHLTGQMSILKHLIVLKEKTFHMKFRSTFQSEIPGETSAHFSMG